VPGRDPNPRLASWQAGVLTTGQRLTPTEQRLTPIKNSYKPSALIQKIMISKEDIWPILII